jgi:hypothetical protein
VRSAKIVKNVVNTIQTMKKLKTTAITVDLTDCNSTKDMIEKIINAKFEANKNLTVADVVFLVNTYGVEADTTAEETTEPKQSWFKKIWHKIF